MKAKEIFLRNSYEKLKNAINDISQEDINDIYALSFYFYAEGDESRYSTIEISYNTNEQYKSETDNASSDIEAKWNYAFWLQEEIGKIGGEEDKLLYDWFKSTPYFYSEEEIEQSKDNDELFDKILDLGEKFENEFIEEVIILTKRLFDEEIIEQKFGKNIPILIHELEYYEKPINWTQKANKPELIEEFINAYKNQKI